MSFEYIDPEESDAESDLTATSQSDDPLDDLLNQTVQNSDPQNSENSVQNTEEVTEVTVEPVQMVQISDQSESLKSQEDGKLEEALMRQSQCESIFILQRTKVLSGLPKIIYKLTGRATISPRCGRL